MVASFCRRLRPRYFEGECAGRVMGVDGDDAPHHLVVARRQRRYRYRHQGLVGGIDFGILLIHLFALRIEDLDFAEGSFELFRKPDLHHGGRCHERAANFGIGMVEEGVGFREGGASGE